ncbi:Mss1p [Saccharomyces cerevisiae x Saccharomyces kudriavzevii VIN7]|uniref:Mss1p n=1 Tax=Saccharomyces cerevisiae x Saccharomyces kudriavzevii (strain VIN7) TaxID=1095631 RepID=H0GZ71_SACCK|nr:Mss1p [Saccharomyces cerevisiae x Saccharomyces kudriavzevii VIN7]
MNILLSLRPQLISRSPFVKRSLRRYSGFTKPVTSQLPTIYALSTPANRTSAIAIIRISGTHSKYIYNQLVNSNEPPPIRKAILRNIYSPPSISPRGSHCQEAAKVLDSSLLLYFQAPRSFTGEDVLELHVHGGKAVVYGILKAIESLHDRNSGKDIRFALPGDFSRRAFQNGKFDLTQLEGIKDLIDSETESQRRSALSSFNGENKVLFGNWRKTIIESMAQLTAIIDFADDNSQELDNTDMIFHDVENNIKCLREEIVTFMQKVRKSIILQDGIKLVLLGAPNVGKSSLVNSLTNDDISIVSDIPGTTRDSVDAIININGYKVIICDTAGIRDKSADKIEILGIERARKKSIQSDLCLFIVDPTNFPKLVPEDILAHLSSDSFRDKRIVIVVNKSDLVSNDEIVRAVCTLRTKVGMKYSIVHVSCKTKEGIEPLIGILTENFKHLSQLSADSNPVIVSKRVSEILRNDVLYGLEEFLGSKDFDNDIVMATENLKYASDGIAKITGQAVGIEEILDSVFSKFCIGK